MAALADEIQAKGRDGSSSEESIGARVQVSDPHKLPFIATLPLAIGVGGAELVTCRVLGRSVGARGRGRPGGINHAWCCVPQNGAPRYLWISTHPSGPGVVHSTAQQRVPQQHAPVFMRR